MGVMTEAFPPLCKSNSASFYMSSVDLLRMRYLIAVSNLHILTRRQKGFIPTQIYYINTDLLPIGTAISL